MYKYFLFLACIFCFISCQSTQKSSENQTQSLQTPTQLIEKEALIFQVAGKLSVEEARAFFLSYIGKSTDILRAIHPEETFEMNELVFMLLFTDPQSPNQFTPAPFIAGVVCRDGIISYATFNPKKTDPHSRKNFKGLLEWGNKPYEALDDIYEESYQIAQKFVEKTIIQELSSGESLEIYSNVLQKTLELKKPTGLKKIPLTAGTTHQQTQHTL